MLPRINPQQRLELSNHRVLVRIRPHLYGPGLGILDQPSPPAPLDPRQLSIHDLLQTIEPSISLVDSLSQLPSRRLSSTGGFGRQVFPEKGVVEVPSAVEVDQWLQRDLSGWRLGGCG